MESRYGDGEVFKPGERWMSPRGTCYYVHATQVGGNATLRTLAGPWAEPIPGGHCSPGRLRRVPWDGVVNWVRYAYASAETTEPPAMSKPPLWEVMHHAFWKCPKENWRLSSSYMIRALRDWLVPEEEPCPDMAIEALLRDERQRLRALLTAEADRAERGGTADD